MIPQQQAPQPPPNPLAMLQQQGQQVVQQAQQHIQQLQGTITIDAIVKFLRDEKMRSFAVEIETDSTIMPDEAAEKQTRGEFLQAFGQASSGVQQLLQLGPSGADLAGGIMKFSLAPYRVGRQLDAKIDAFIEQAPQVVQQQMQAQQGGQDPALAQAQQQLAQAELQKAQAQAAKVQADAQLKAQQLQLDMAKAQSEATHRQQTLAMEAQQLQLEIQQSQATLEETLARIEHVKAETQALLANAETARLTAQNDSVRAITEVGAAQFEQDQAMLPQVGGNETV
ncbi:MAG: hypothetical protein ABF968_04870 [Acetobacter sp.]|uniref:hypothetical protein n=1 Tax=Acetobacter sp. TaxID=440 RepID=UPI0039ED6777